MMASTPEYWGSCLPVGVVLAYGHSCHKLSSFFPFFLFLILYKIVAAGLPIVEVPLT